MNTLLGWMAQNSLVVAGLLPIVWLLSRCRLLKNRPAEQHLLWLLLLIKLVTPPIFTSPLPLPSPLQMRSALALPAAEALVPTEGNRQPLADLEIEALVLASGAPANDVAELPPPAAPASIAMPIISASDLEVSPTIAAPARLTNASVFDSQCLAVVVVALWLTGSMVACGLAARRLLQLWRVLRRGAPASRELDIVVQQQANLLRMKRVFVRVVSSARGPFVTCLGRPCLVWPTAMETKDSIIRSSAVIAHELAHVKRRDHYVAWLELAANLVWWWNPLFWLIRKRLHETREMACDALALQSSCESRRNYAELLLEITAGERPRSFTAPAFGAGKMFHGSLQRRLEMVFNERASGGISAAALALVFALAIVAIPRWSFGQAAPPATEDPAAEVPAAADPAPATAPATPVFEQPVAPPQPSQPPPTIQVETQPAQRTPQPVEPAEAAVAREQVLELPDNSGLLRLQIRHDGTLVVVIEQNGQVAGRYQMTLNPSGEAPATAPAIARIAQPVPRSVPRRPAAAPRIVYEHYVAPEPQIAAAAPPSSPESHPTADIDLLRVECELAEVNLEKKRVELEQAQKVKAEKPDSISDSELKLLALAVKEAELGLRKCHIQLRAVEQRVRR